MSEKVVLFQVDSKTATALTQQTALSSRVVFEEVVDSKLLIDRLASGERIAAVVLGSKVNSPLGLAERVHFIDSTTDLFILTKPRQHAGLVRAVTSSSILNGSVFCEPVADTDKLAEKLCDAVKARAPRSESNRRRAGLIYASAVLDGSPLGIVEIDRRAVIITLNNKASQILGIIEREALGLPLWALFSTRERKGLIEFIAASNERSLPPKVFERNHGAAVQYIELSIAATPMNGGQASSVAFLHDATARHISEEKLKNSEDRYRDLVESSQDLICTHDLDGRILSVNAGAARCLGYDPGELVDKNLSDILAPDKRAELSGYLKLIRETGRATGMMVVLTRAGERRLWEYNNTVRTTDVKEPFVRGLAHDVTEKEKADEELQCRARQQAAVAELGKRALASTDVSTLLKEAATLVANTLNVEYCQIRELIPEQCELVLRAGVGRKNGGPAETSVRAEPASQIGYAAATGEPVVIEDPNLETRFAESSLLSEYGIASGAAIPIKIQDRVFGVLSAHSANRRTFSRNDIHFMQASANLLAGAIERKQAEQALRMQALMLESLAEGVNVTDQNGAIIYTNPACDAMFGYGRGELLGRHVSVLSPEAGDENALLVLQVVEKLNREALWFGEIENQRKDGSGFTTYARVSGMMMSGKRFSVAVREDITERKRAEQALRQYADRLKILREIDQAILAARSAEQIAQAAVKRISQMVPCERASVMVFDFELQEAVLVAASGLAQDTLNAGFRLGFDEVILSNIDLLRKGDISRVDDLRTLETENPLIRVLASVGVCAHVAIPIMSRGRLLGAFNLSSTRTASFTAEDVSIARDVADSLAVAMEQARLHDEIRAGQERLQTLSHRLLEIQELERHRIARELHDEIGQVLTAVKINVQAAQRFRETAQGEEMLDESINITDRALKQVRDLSLDLRPSLLDDLGLVAALRWYVDKQSQRSGLAIQLRAEDLKERLQQEIETACFRVAQEALTNVIRHAAAGEVLVELRTRESDLELIVRDDGAGFDFSDAARKAEHGGTFGLLSMQERVSLAGGAIEIKTRPKCGTEVRARFPVLRREPAAMEVEHRL